MKKILSFTVLFFVMNMAFSQSFFGYEKPLSKIYTQVGFTQVSVLDPYLSLMEYKGYGMRLDRSKARYINPKNKKFISYAKASFMPVVTSNPANTASMMYMALDGSWGFLYEERTAQNVRFLMGGLIDLDMNYKMLSRNVNNPVAFDISGNLNAMMGMEVFMPTKSRIMKLRTDVEWSVIGGMFTPLPGLTFYEMSISNDYLQAMHFTSMHNKQKAKFQLALDIPIYFNTWTIGMRYHPSNYQLKHHSYHTREFNIFLGISYDRVRFGGRKDIDPLNYTGPGEYYY